jgi:L-fuconolactonase
MPFVIVVDSQVHIWEQGQPPSNHRQQPFTAADLLREMEVAKVERAILVPPTWDPGGNRCSVRAAASHPERFAVMGLVNLFEPRTPDDFADWLKADRLLGVRVSFNNPTSRAHLTNGHADWLWRSAEEAGAPVMVLAPYLLPLVRVIACQHPGLKIVVDHMAIPRGQKAPAAFAHLPELKALARLENVAVKMGGVPNYANNDRYPYRSLHEHLKDVIDAFGPMRCFWGSDFSRLVGSYAECVSLFRDELDWLTLDERTAIMGRGLCRWLNWNV